MPSPLGVEARTEALSPQHSWPWAGSVAEVMGPAPPHGAHAFPPTTRMCFHLVTAASLLFLCHGGDRGCFTFDSFSRLV